MLLCETDRSVQTGGLQRQSYVPKVRHFQEPLHGHWSKFIFVFLPISSLISLSSSAVLKSGQHSIVLMKQMSIFMSLHLVGVCVGKILPRVTVLPLSFNTAFFPVAV